MLAATSGQSVYRVKFFCSNSKAFRLMECLFDAGQQHLRLGTAERKAMSRLVRAGLVKTSREKSAHDCCGHAHVRYSLTLAGRANYVAAELGLSFTQLCYLACARKAARNSVLNNIPAFFVKDVHPIFGMLFGDVSPSVTRWELARKGFLGKCVWHASAMTSRFAELDRFAAVMDELYRWMKTEYDRRFLEAIQDPVIAKLVGLVPPKPEA